MKAASVYLNCYLSISPHKVVQKEGIVVVILLLPD